MGDAVSHVSSDFLDDLKEILALFRWQRDSPEQPALPKHDEPLWAKARKKAKQELDDAVREGMKRYRGSAEPPTGTLKISAQEAERLLRKQAERAMLDRAERIYRQLDTKYAKQARAAETDFRDKQERLDHLLTIHKEALLAYTIMRGGEGDPKQLQAWDVYSLAASPCPSAEPYQSVVIKDLVVMIANLEERVRQEDTSQQQPASPKKKRKPTGTQETDWRDVQDRLLNLRNEGKPYTDQRDLADRLNCSPPTVNKAIKNSPTLTGWMARYRKKSPKAQSLNAVVMEQTPDERERDPADALPDDDVDVVMSKLIQEAPTPEYRDKLNAMGQDERRKMAEVYSEHIKDPEYEPPGLSDGKRKPVKLLGRKP